MSHIESWGSSPNEQVIDPMPGGLERPHVAWVFLDESGTPDFDASTQPAYFAFGSATYTHLRPVPLHPFQQVRALRHGVLNGFHAYNDSRGTRAAFFEMMGLNPASYEATFMWKAGAHDRVQLRPRIWMYKYTLYRHLQQVIPNLLSDHDIIHVVAAHIDMGAKQDAVRHAIEDVCAQFSGHQEVNVHIWRSPTSAGLQIADYALWAIQRQLFKGDCREYEAVVAPHLRNIHYPWGHERGQLSL